VAIADAAIGEEPVLGSEVRGWIGLDYWVLIGGLRVGEVATDSVDIEESGDGKSRCRCVAINPTVPIVDGKTCEVIWRGEAIFSGLIRTLTIDSDQAEAVFRYSIEADGWDSLLARHTITKTYSNVMAGQILRDAILASGLSLDGVTAGLVDDGIQLLLAEANHVRVSDFIRDIGVAGGGVAFINPYKQIVFRPLSVDVADMVITTARAETIQHMSDLDNYRNRQVVKVTGTSGATVTETRDDLVQQALRIADEGGSGIYEDYQEVKHPTSNVVGELSIMGQTVGFVQLRTYAKNARRVTVTMREPAPRIGQLTVLDLPGFGLSGTFLAMRKTWRESSGAFLFDVEFWESSFQQFALESLLRIVGAGKAAVSISANVFPNVQLFSTPGTFTWTVPAGVTTAQFTNIGGSAGGGGGRRLWGFSGSCFVLGFATGGDGGNSGKAITIRAVSAGQVFDLVVGAAGTSGITGEVASICTGGSTISDGGTGGLSSVKLGAVTVCQADGGTAGLSGAGGTNGADGVAGGGIGDAVSVGGGHVGGQGGKSYDVDGIAGIGGLIEVRW
jgi:hypothetical protein